MQLQELKKLIEYDAVETFMATRSGKGWVLLALKGDQGNNADTVSNNSLELARGGVRVFKTLDAINKLVKSELHSKPFIVC